MATTSSKVLIPLTTLLVAGAVAVGSGATWTSTTGSSVSVTAGTLLQSNDRNNATLTLSNIKPGDSMTGTVKVTNTGTVNSTLDIAASGVSNSFTDNLTISVTENGTSLYSGPFRTLALTQPDLAFAPTEVATYAVTVALSQDAPNADQAKTAGAKFTFTQTQVAGETLVEKWVPGV